MTLAGGVLSAQSYTDLTGFNPQDMSADGSTIVGSGDVGNGFEAVSFDVASGVLTGLGEDGATCVSGDGSGVGGEMDSTGNGGYYTAGSWTDIGTLNTAGLSCGGSSVPNDMSANGLRLVGSDWPNTCTLDAIYWDTTGGGINSLPKLGGGSARADVISGDALTIGGYERFTGSQNQAAIWQWDPVALDFTTPMLVTQGIDFGDGNLDGLGVVTAMNADGSVAAIEAGLNSAPNVKVWRSNGTVTDLGPIPGVSGVRPTPTGITADGSMIVGRASGGFFGPPPVGFIWTEAAGMQTADSFFAAAGVPLPPGFASASVDGVTDDGKRFYGSSGSFPFFSYWVIDVGNFTPYSVGVSPVNSLSLAGSGSTSTAGGVFTLTTTGVATSPVVFGGISRSPINAPLFGGVLLINPTPGQLQPLFVDPAAGGTSTHSMAIPMNPTLAGLAFYCQTAAPDPGMVAGWSLSNGVRGIICP